MANTNPSGHDTWYSKLFSSYDFFDKEAAMNRYMQEFMRITNRMFKWEGLPDTIPERILEEFLQRKGIVYFAKCRPLRSSDRPEDFAEEGLYVFYGGYGGGRDVYYEPTVANIANPAVPNLPVNLNIGEECCVCFNDSQKQGLVPMFQKYAKLLVENDISIYDAEINLRIQTLIQASDDRTKASAELYLQNIEKGSIGIIAGKSLDPETALATKPFVTGGNSNALSQLIEMHQYLKASLLNELGLNANYNMKRERINSAESELNNDGLLPLVDDMLEMRKQAAEKINAMFGTDITVDKASAWEFRQLAAEVDAMNPEGVDEEAPAENDPEEAPEEAPEEKKEDDDDDGTEKTE